MRLAIATHLEHLRGSNAPPDVIALLEKELERYGGRRARPEHGPTAGTTADEEPE